MRLISATVKRGGFQTSRGKFVWISSLKAKNERQSRAKLLKSAPYEIKGRGGLLLFYQLQGLKLTLCAAQVEANVILGMYLISPPCVFQGSFVIEKRGEKRCWKKYTHAFFLQLIRSNRVFFLKRRHVLGPLQKNTKSNKILS